jgi:hypothetical protein
MILSGMEFNLLTELSGSEGRLDLCLALPKQVYCVIELKYCPSQSKLSEDEKNQTLAKAAMRRLPDLSNASLAAAIENKLSMKEFRKALSKIDILKPTEADTNRILADNALEYLNEAEYAATLALVARKKLPEGEIKAILKSATPTESLSDEKIDEILSKAAMEALDQIAKNDYHGPLKLKAKEFIDLGLSVYGSGAKVEAVFGPEPKASSKIKKITSEDQSILTLATKSSRTKSSRTKSSSTKSSPTKTSPTKSSQTKTSPTKSSRSKSSPTKSSPNKSSPTKTSPTKSSPTKSSPTKSSPTKSSPTKSSSTKSK